MSPHTMETSKIIIYIKLLRAPFFTAAIVPILVGTAIAYSSAGVFNPVIFVLALVAMIAFQGGANITNDYFDHLSRNDWLNDNATPFSGGSRVIQQNLLAPPAVLRYAIIVFTLGIIAGLAIVVITKSIFILIIGTIGILGAFFYTARPVSLGYRTAGEITIGLLLGFFPVYGAYYIQTLSFDYVSLLPAVIVGFLIFEIIMANEFPDYNADKAVGKKNIVVAFGIEKAAFVYNAVLVLMNISVLAWLIFFAAEKIAASVVFVISIILTVICYKQTDPAKLQQKGVFSLSRATVLLHLLTGLSLAAAEVVSKF